jgi:hypothetical protein
MFASHDAITTARRWAWSLTRPVVTATVTRLPAAREAAAARATADAVTPAATDVVTAADAVEAGAAAVVAAAAAKAMTTLEKITHGFLIAVCCLAGGLLIEQRFFPSQEAENVPSRDPVGREVKLPGADWQAAPISVLLQLSSTCHFCNESMPFYKQLMAARQAQGGKVPVIVASSDAVAVMRKHLEDEQVIVDKVLHSRLESFATGTPTVYIVDSKGLVRRAFIGKLDPSGEKELLSIIERGKV